MATERLLSDDVISPEVRGGSSHPRDSSRLLLALMDFARKAEVVEGDTTAEKLGGAISAASLRSLISALQIRDPRTVWHSRRAAMLAVGIAQHLGWEPALQNYLEVAAILHDIGKIGVPDSILFKPGKLNPDESELMALHHNIAVDVLQACRVHQEVLDIVSQSNRYFDAETTGYRLVGGTVHQGSRILAVADAYDSLRNDQPYREGKSHQEALRILMDSAGTQFDGNVVSALSRCIESEGLPYSAAADELPGGQPAAASLPPEDALEANALAHIFSYLYVLESLYDGFYLVDSDMRFVIWNRGSERLLNRSAGETLGQVWSSRMFNYADQHGEPLHEDDCPMNRVIGLGKSVTSMLQIERTDGRKLDVELQTVPIFDEAGQLHGVAEIFRDLTRTSRRPREYRELKLAASRDPLTSAANRGELETQLALMLAAYSKKPEADVFSVLFLDIDFFKNINDTFGHTVGDQVLIDLARLLQHETYSGELVARYGGEEFVILCPDTSLEQAFRRAERLRMAIVRSELGGLVDYKVTGSIGVTQVEPGDSVESVLRRADKALYSAKHTGRNKSCSLMNADLENMSAAGNELPNETTDPFEYKSSFNACIAADMVVYKLGGFVNDHRAKLAEVSQTRAVIRVGRSGLFRFWGSTDENLPVEIVVEFGKQQVVSRGRAASKQVEITVQIKPLCKTSNPEPFQERAKRLARTLRSYFAGE